MPGPPEAHGAQRGGFDARAVGAGEGVAVDGRRGVGYGPERVSGVVVAELCLFDQLDEAGAEGAPVLPHGDLDERITDPVTGRGDQPGAYSVVDEAGEEGIGELLLRSGRGRHRPVGVRVDRAPAGGQVAAHCCCHAGSRAYRTI
jgi:hypothetical protein